MTYYTSKTLALKYIGEINVSFRKINNTMYFYHNITNTKELWLHHESIMESNVNNKYYDIATYYYILLNLSYIQYEKILYTKYSKKLEYYLLLSSEYEYELNKMRLYMLFKYYMDNNKLKNALRYWKIIKYTKLVVSKNYIDIITHYEKQNAIIILKPLLLYTPYYGILYKRSMKSYYILCKNT